MTRTLTPPTPPPARAAAPATWDDLVRRAVSEGIVSTDQAAALRGLAPAAGPPVPGGHGRLRAWVAEALGYVGAALVLVAGMVTVGQFWAELAPWAHVALAGLLAVVLLAAGAVVSGEPGTPLGRLGSVLWFTGAGAVVGTSALAATELAGLEDAASGVAAFAPATAVAVVLWWRRRRALQEVAVVVGLIGTSASLLGMADVEMGDWGGLLVWAIGVAWLALAWGEVVQPARTGRVVGAAVALVGPLMAFGASGRWGPVLGVVTAGALVAASVPARETVMLGLGVIGLFVFVPNLVFEYFGDELGAPMALLLSGVVLLGVSLWIARSRRGTDGET